MTPFHEKERAPGVQGMLRAAMQGTAMGALVGGVFGVLSHQFGALKEDPRRYEFGPNLAYLTPATARTFPDLYPILEAVAELKPMRTSRQSARVLDLIVTLMDELCMLYIDLTKQSSMFINAGVIQVKIHRIFTEVKKQVAIFHDMFLQSRSASNLSVSSEEICNHLERCCDNLIHNMLQANHRERNLRGASLKPPDQQEQEQGEDEAPLGSVEYLTTDEAVEKTYAIDRLSDKETEELDALTGEAGEAGETGTGGTEAVNQVDNTHTEVIDVDLSVDSTEGAATGGSDASSGTGKGEVIEVSITGRA